MAEQFVKPKTFTKEWFGYVWDYYKWYMISGVFFIVLLVMFVVTFFTNDRSDANINFIATTIIPQEKAQKIEEICQKNSNDINENKNVDISFTQLNFTEANKEDIEAHRALMEKRMILYADEDELIFIVDSGMFSEVVESKYTEGMFVKSSEWVKGDYTKAGEYAVSLKGSTAFKEAGIDSSEMYILVAKNRKDGLQEKERNAINIANFLIK